MGAQKNEKISVEGKAVKIEHTKGSFVGADGGSVDYDFHEVKLLTDEMDMTIVRFPKGGPVPLPVKGDVVRYLCDARAAGGNVKLTAEAWSPVTYAELYESAQVKA